MLALKQTQLQEGFKTGFIDQFLGTNPWAESTMPHAGPPGSLSAQAATASPSGSDVNVDNAVPFGPALPRQRSLTSNADISSPDTML